jgi:ribosome-binding factor A
MANERRRKQISRRIQAKLANILLYEMKDPRASFLTITEVDINRDLTVAKVFWSALNSSGRSKIEHLLKHAHGFLRTEVAQDLQLRSAPELLFIFDERLALQDRMEELLSDLVPDESNETALDPESGPPPEPEV